jgi:hypothetical protein
MARSRSGASGLAALRPAALHPFAALRASAASRSLCPQIASACQLPACATTPTVSSCDRSSAVAVPAAGPTVAPIGASQNGGA